MSGSDSSSLARSAADEAVLRAARLAGFVAREVVPPAPHSEPLGQGARLLLAARERAGHGRRRHRILGLFATAGAAAAAGIVVSMTTGQHAPVLSYTVDGAAPPPDGLVRSSAAQQPTLTFSDGTNVQIMPKARARVVALGRRGARLRLEDGRAHVQVAHRPGADWQVQVGAFLIHVHGTAFVVEWNATEGRLGVQMESGVISIDGPLAGETVMLRAGQSLSVGPGERAKVSALHGAGTGAARAGGAVLAAPTAVPGALPPEAAPPAAEAPVATGRPAPAVTTVAARARWTDRLADGDAAGIVAEARQRGLAVVLKTAGTEDLAALADAARFRQENGLAQRVLLAQRKRFPGTLRAEEASFLLGRLADGGGARDAHALAWYGRYLHEAPSGVYADEAMGRMMLVLDRQQRTEEARDVATSYLSRFPRGSYARAARAVLSPGH